jgi:protein-tyrosine kinase
MSRIHEALKKAQEERSAQLAAQPSEMPAAPAPESAPASYAPTVAIETPDAPATAPKDNESAPLTIETILSRCRQRRWNIDPAAIVVGVNDDGQSTQSEVFRTLRTRLYQIRAQQPLRTVLITSALPGEGKTFVTSNLAQSVARQGERHILMIDADLRLSNLHTPLGAESSPGLTDYLLGEKDEFAILQRGRAENQFLIAGGKSVQNPTELLSNGRLEQLLERMSSVFDWILIDSPPVIPVSDANILSKMCDGVLMVVRSGTTPFDLAQKACEGFVDRPLLGAVLNRTNPREGYGGYYYQGYSAETQKHRPQTNGNATA